MKNIAALEIYYKREISPNLTTFRQLMNRSKYIIIVTLIAFANIFIGIGGEKGLIVTGVIVGIGFALMFYTHKKIQTFYTEKIVLPIMQQIGDEQLSFNLQGKIDKDILKKSNLLYFSKNYTLVQDKILNYQEKNRTITMINIQLKNTTHDMDGDSNITTTEGLFVLVPTPIKIEKDTIVLIDFAEQFGGYIGQLFQSKKSGNLKQIRLDSPEFEKKFIVYGEDELSTHYILKQTVMEELNKITKKIKFQFEISFIDSNICIFYPISGGWLSAEVAIDKKKEEMLHFEIIKNDLEIIFDTIDLIHKIEKHHHIY